MWSFKKGDLIKVADTNRGGIEVQARVAENSSAIDDYVTAAIIEEGDAGPEQAFHKEQVIGRVK